MLLTGFGLSVLDDVLFGADGIIDLRSDVIFEANLVYSLFAEDPLENIFYLSTLIPTFSVSARRLHDIDKSGWWQVIPLGGLVLMGPGVYAYFFGEPYNSIVMSIAGGVLVAFALIVLLIVWYCRDSERGANRFGESSKYSSIGETFS